MSVHHRQSERCSLFGVGFSQRWVCRPHRRRQECEKRWQTMARTDVVGDIGRSDRPAEVPAIEISGLTKVYGTSETKAVDDVSLSVPAGTVFGFLGPNGAGKTTT